MPLSSVLSDLRGLLESAVDTLTETPQQAPTDFFSPPSIPTLCLFLFFTGEVRVCPSASRAVWGSLFDRHKSRTAA